jgi:DNA-binding LytR/AlgR family response regulator
MILIVEDEPFIAIELERLFKETLDCTVKFAHNHHDAVAIFDKYRSDLQIATIDWSVGRGEADVHLYDYMRQRRPDLYIFAVTGHKADVVLNGRNLEGEPFAHVEKPFETERLINLILTRPVWKNVPLRDFGAQP